PRGGRTAKGAPPGCDVGGAVEQAMNSSSGKDQLMDDRSAANEEVSQRRDCFARLLNGFSFLATRGDTPAAPLTVRMSALLKQFGECRVRADKLEQAQTAASRARIRALLDGYNETVEHYRQQQEEVADDFNLLDVMRLTGKEIRHSMVLAWLLDHDLRKLGTHAQGNLGFRLFLS